VLLGLNVLSEFVSYSKLIEALPPLRMLDQLGRRRPSVIDLREDSDDLDAAFTEPFYPTKPAPSMQRTSAERGNVGGAPDGDHAEVPPQSFVSSDQRIRESGIADVPSDLFGISEDDFLTDDIAERELDDSHARQDHRHN
jgi:hypothetical protein